MMAFDMGGPLNKVAYSFAAAGVGAAAAPPTDAPELKIMAAVMLAGMVPPLALALATVVRPGLFTAAERENGKAAWLLGASFITEGAIPFAAADPLRVIPAIMVGSAVTGGDVDGPGRRRASPARRHLRALRGRATSLGYLIASSPASWSAAALVIAAKSARPHRRRRRHRLTTPPTHPRSAPTQRRTMPSKSVVVGSAVGLHARPAAIIAEKAAELGSDVTINGVDASSSLMIMTLGAGNGDTVEVAGDDQAAVDAIAALVEQDLDA